MGPSSQYHSIHEKLLFHTLYRKEAVETVPRVPDTTCLSTVDEDNNYAVFVSYIEIYNNLIYDLLEEMPVTLHAK